MNVVFICGCLEPGKDGVGDYTVLIASEMIRKGHSVSVIAINDTYASDFISGVQQMSSMEVPVYRIPKLWDTKLTYEKMYEIVQELKPDWVSLQFVPFAFQDKGLPAGFGSALKKLGSHIKFHVMFHELWVGMASNSPKKQLAWGYLQRVLIKGMLKKIKPLVINTHTTLYQHQLSLLGFKAEILPLFSNIPRSHKTARAGAEEVAKNGITFIIFGNIHHGAPMENFAQEVMEYGREKGIAVTLKLIGRCGSDQDKWISSWEKMGLQTINMGEQNADTISKELNNATYGISTTPYLLAQKSGTVAAMRNHDLPVICVSYTWDVNGFNERTQAGVYEYKPGNLNSILNNIVSEPFHYDQAEVSEMLVKSLLKAS